MQCQECRHPNDDDAAFCEGCGGPLAPAPSSPLRQRNAYLWILSLVAGLIVLAGIGYYKFVLPEGVIAVVNGEEIRRHELDAAVERAQRTRGSLYGPAFFEGTGGAQRLIRLRTDTLNDLVRERILLQEARNSGIVVTDAEALQAFTAMREAAGMDHAAFRTAVLSRYGSEQAAVDRLRRRIMIDRLLAERVTAGISDAREAREAAGKWFREVSGRALVRISLPEQWSAAECGCCGPGAAGTAEARPDRGCSGCGVKPGEQAGGGAPPDPVVEKMVREAGIAYWKKNRGDAAVSARVFDFGCHQEVELQKGGELIARLRYQNGVVSEMRQP